MGEHRVKKAFPAQRPRIVVERLESEAADLDIRELTWWFVVPELGEHVDWAEYQPVDGGSTWRLTRTVAMSANRRAVIHGRECIEIDLDTQWLSVAGVPAPPPADRDTRVWGRLTETQVEWIALESVTAEGAGTLYTFLDDHFEENFGACERRVEAGDFLTAQGGGAFVRREGTPELFADGVCDVAIGGSTFRCTRVVEIPAAATERDVVIVAYIDSAGRTVLFRRYDGDQRTMPGAPAPLRDALPHAERLVIDGMTFVHCFDDVTTAAGDALG